MQIRSCLRVIRGFPAPLRARGRSTRASVFSRGKPAAQRKQSDPPLLHGVHPIIACLYTGSRPCEVLHVIETAKPIVADLQEAIAADSDAQAIAPGQLAAMIIGRLPLHDVAAPISRALRQLAKSGPAKAAALALVSDSKVRVQWHTKAQLNAIAARSAADSEAARSHQGVLLECGEVTLVHAEDELKRIEQLWHGCDDDKSIDWPKPPVVVALDQVTDPNNLGAIARSITFFGLQGLILSSKNCARPSPVASKASAGTLETLAASSRLLQTSQLHKCLGDAASRGWCVLGAHASPNIPNQHEPQPIELTAGSLTKPTVLVLGSEGIGLRPLIRSQCTNTVAIAGPSDAAGLCDSLNVASAAAVLLSRLCEATTPQRN